MSIVNIKTRINNLNIFLEMPMAFEDQKLKLVSKRLVIGKRVGECRSARSCWDGTKIAWSIQSPSWHTFGLDIIQLNCRARWETAGGPTPTHIGVTVLQGHTSATWLVIFLTLALFIQHYHSMQSKCNIERTQRYFVNIIDKLCTVSRATTVVIVFLKLNLTVIQLTSF